MRCNCGHDVVGTRDQYYNVIEYMYTYLCPIWWPFRSKSVLYYIFTPPPIFLLILSQIQKFTSVKYFKYSILNTTNLLTIINLKLHNTLKCTQYTFDLLTYLQTSISVLITISELIHNITHMSEYYHVLYINTKTTASFPSWWWMWGILSFVSLVPLHNIYGWHITRTEKRQNIRENQLTQDDLI